MMDVNNLYDSDQLSQLTSISSTGDAGHVRSSLWLLGLTNDTNPTINMKKILVPVDFSSTSENAASYAAQLSIEIHAELILLHVYQYPVLLGDVPYPVEAYAQIADDAEKSLGELAEKLGRQLNGRRVAKTELKEGSFIHQLEVACKENNPDVVVMGCSGVSAAGKFFFGSNALQAIRHLHHPVLLVPPGAAYSDIKQIGLLSDLVNAETSIPVRSAIHFVNALHATLTVALITTGLDYSVPGSEETKRMEELFAPTPIGLRSVHDESFEDGVARFVKKCNLDLLIIAPFKHSFFSRLFQNTHTEQLLKHPIVPTLFLKAVEKKD